jgi:hypothetical protein
MQSMKWQWETIKDISGLEGIIITFFANKLGILGVKSSGKSTLRELIIESQLHGDTKGTSNHVIKYRIKITRNNNRSISLSYIDDTGGERHNYPIKKEVFENVDFILYVVRSDYIAPSTHTQVQSLPNDEQNRYIDYLKTDFANFNKWRKRQHARFIIVGNYFGQLSEEDRKNMVQADPSKYGIPDFSDSYIRNVEYLRKFKEKFSEIVGGAAILSGTSYVVGSLVSGEFANQLVLDILEILDREQD